MSVVIPARNAEAMIGRTVAAVLGQELDGGFEVVVVDDGSTDATAENARAAGARVVSNATALGPADARNAGVGAAQGELIAFTDADCVPAPGWLQAGVSALGHADLVQGCVEPEPGVPVGPFDHTITVREESGLYETANLFVRREWFERVGGFRAFIEPSQGHFGEDLVFGWEVRRAGGRSAFAADAVVHHEVVTRPASAWIAERRRLRLFPEATRAVPELRSRWFLGLFLSRRTAKLDLAVAALLLALVTRRPLLLLLALPYARATFRTDQWYRRWVVKQNAAHLAGDVVGLLALIEGSVKAKQIVL
ncbi:MAG TPA: glycosyltransferase family 2 protein [Burkholderiaceae bacterium]|nr:glycosyltransferase family 2 protein [Burkholderiaceae bacterium]